MKWSPVAVVTVTFDADGNAVVNSGNLTAIQGVNVVVNGSLANGITTTITGLDSGTKYTLEMQAKNDNDVKPYSKITKVSASTAKYAAPKKDKVNSKLGEVTFSWKQSTVNSAGMVGNERTYIVGIFVGNEFILPNEDGTFSHPSLAGVTIAVNQMTRTAEAKGLASQRYTFGVQEQVEVTGGDTAKSAVAKITASPSPYKAPKFNIPAPIANGSTKLELKSASVTAPATSDQTYGYEVGVYDNATKQYIWGEASVLTDGYTSEDGKDWTITGAAKGMKIALREVLYAADGTAIAKSVMQKITLK